MRIIVRGCIESDLTFNNQLKLTKYIKHITNYKKHCIDNHVIKNRLLGRYTDIYSEAAKLYPLTITITQ